MSGFWRGRRVLVTGHTGFKGGWLCLWLHRMGAEIAGYSLPPPTDPSLFVLADVGQLVDSRIGDVRDADALAGVLDAVRPEIVFHLAAQPLVLGGYSDPVGTFEINVMGTVCLFQAIRSTPGVRAVVNVTTDKCYVNDDVGAAFKESDPLGGHEPYGASKACSEIVTQAFCKSYFDPDRYSEHGVAVATARAGNVIGGGDWGEKRLVPDIVRSLRDHRPVKIRRPGSIRPWQHVLEPISGYLRLARRLVERGPEFNGGWNFGPSTDSARPVSWIVDRCVRSWGEGAKWTLDTVTYPPEARVLQLDCSKAKAQLGWEPRMCLEETIEATIDWYHGVASGCSARDLCDGQIDAFGDGELQ